MNRTLHITVVIRRIGTGIYSRRVPGMVLFAQVICIVTDFTDRFIFFQRSRLPKETRRT